MTDSSSKRLQMSEAADRDVQGCPLVPSPSHTSPSKDVLLTEGGEQSGGRAQGVRQRSAGER